MGTKGSVETEEPDVEEDAPPEGPSDGNAASEQSLESTLRGCVPPDFFDMSFADIELGEEISSDFGHRRHEGTYQGQPVYVKVYKMTHPTIKEYVSTWVASRVSFTKMSKALEAEGLSDQLMPWIGTFLNPAELELGIVFRSRKNMKRLYDHEEKVFREPGTFFRALRTVAKVYDVCWRTVGDEFTLQRPTSVSIYCNPNGTDLSVGMDGNCSGRDGGYAADVEMIGNYVFNLADEFASRSACEKSTLMDGPPVSLALDSELLGLPFIETFLQACDKRLAAGAEEAGLPVGPPRVVSYGVNVVLPAPIADVWAVCGDFRQQSRVFGMPPEAATIEETEEGMTRTFNGFDGKPVTEMLVARSEETHTLSYMIIQCESAMSNDTYVAGVHLEATDDGHTRVQWFGTITVPEAELEMRTGALKELEGMIAGGLQKLFPEAEAESQEPDSDVAAAVPAVPAVSVLNHVVSYGVNVTLPASVADVWAVCGDFRQQSRVFGMPPEAATIEETEEGITRTFDGFDGKPVTEMLVARSEETLTLSYKIIRCESAMSNDTYVAGVHLEAVDDGHTRVQWFGSITVPEAELEMRTGALKELEGMIAGGLQKLFPEAEADSQEMNSDVVADDLPAAAAAEDVPVSVSNHVVSYGVNLTLPASVADVWAVCGDFRQQSRVFGMPPEAATIEETEEGITRTFDGFDGKPVTEMLVARSDENHTLSYKIIRCESAMSNDTYVAGVHLEAVDDGHTRVQWFGTITVPEAELEMRTGALKELEGMIAGGLQKLFPGTDM